MCGLGSAEHEQSCVISCSHSPPEGNLSVLIGRHGAINRPEGYSETCQREYNWLTTIASLATQSPRFG
jgi:hypothetical protein